MLGAVKTPAPAKQYASNGKKSLTPAPVTQQTIAAPLPTVEVIRGDKRSAEVIR